MDVRNHAMVPAGKHINLSLKIKHCWYAKTHTHIFEGENSRLQMDEMRYCLNPTASDMQRLHIRHLILVFYRTVKRCISHNISDHIGHLCELSYYRVKPNQTSNFRVRLNKVLFFASLLLILTLYKQCYTVLHFCEYWHGKDNTVTLLTACDEIKKYLDQFHCSLGTVTERALSVCGRNKKVPRYTNNRFTGLPFTRCIK